MADSRDDDGGIVSSPPSESGHVLTHLISRILTMTTEGSVSPGSSSVQDTEELSESRDSLAQLQDRMYGAVR